MWTEFRDDRGHLLAKVDWQRELLQLYCRRCGRLHLVDLAPAARVEGKQQPVAADVVEGDEVPAVVPPHGKAI